MGGRKTHNVDILEQFTNNKVVIELGEAIGSVTGEKTIRTSEGRREK